jgi:hypothetical protein
LRETLRPQWRTFVPSLIKIPLCMWSFASDKHFLMSSYCDQELWPRDLVIVHHKASHFCEGWFKSLHSCRSYVPGKIGQSWKRSTKQCFMQNIYYIKSLLPLKNRKVLLYTYKENLWPLRQLLLYRPTRKIQDSQPGDETNSEPRAIFWKNLIEVH